MRDQPLRASIEGDELVIRIGIGTLAHAASHCNLFYDPDSNPSPPYIDITDVERFSQEVANELISEEEDGASLISTTLDQAIEIAYESGSLAVNYRRRGRVPKFNSMFDVAFSVEHDYEDPYDIPLEVLIEALRKRLKNLEEEPNQEAFGLCDTYKIGVTDVSDTES